MVWLVFAAGASFVWAISAFRRPQAMFVSLDADASRVSGPPGLDVVISYILVQSATIAFLAVFAVRRPEMQQTMEALVTLTSMGLLVASLFGYWKSRSRLAMAGIIYGLAAAVCLTAYWFGRIGAGL